MPCSLHVRRMHPALRLEEILANIFGHCHTPTSINKERSRSPTADLAALAITCRTFKEPALDVLWTELANLAPLARCLPDASHRVYPGLAWYSFTRSLTQAEWDTLRGYTRRVRSVLDLTSGLNWDSVKTLFNPPTPDPLFPNLRVLRWEFIRETFPLMSHLAVSPLTSLEINFVFGDLPPFHSFPDSLGELCPNMRKFRLQMRRPQAGSDEAISTLVQQWTNLQDLYCPYVHLDADSLIHLSNTPSLTSLSFALTAAAVNHIISSKSILCLPRLRNLEICVQSLDIISMLLPFIRLPSVESLAVYVDTCPPKHALRSYLIDFQKICDCQSLVSLKVIQTRSPSYASHSERYQLTLEDLRPCMALSGLRHMDINIASTVNLVDHDLLELTSVWPHLECLLINEEWGWKTEGGITPSGLLRLLESHSSLHRFCLAMDTRGYTKHSQVPDLVHITTLAPRTPLSVNVADSMILPESVEALSVFFRTIMEPRSLITSAFWSTSAMTASPDSDMLRRLWEDVFVKAHGRFKFSPMLFS